MADSNIIQPNRLTNMQEMEVHVNGPDGANRMFIYSGMAEVELCGGLPHPRWSLEVVCFDIGRTYDVENEEIVNIIRDNHADKFGKILDKFKLLLFIRAHYALFFREVDAARKTKKTSTSKIVEQIKIDQQDLFIFDTGTYLYHLKERRKPNSWQSKL